MSRQTSIPTNYERIKVVDSFKALFAEPFGPTVNAFVFPRRLKHDFNAMAQALPLDGKKDNYLSRANMNGLYRGLEKDCRHRPALNVIRRDVEEIAELHKTARVDSSLRVFFGASGSANENENFHADGRAVTPFDFENVLCNYAGVTTQFLRNQDAIKADGEFSFYKPRRGARIYSFEPGAVWRIACRYKGSMIEPFVHRAPKRDASGIRVLTSTIIMHGKLQV